MIVRDARGGDPIAELAIACGQTGEVSAESPVYVELVRHEGRLVVAEDDGRLAGFAGVVDRGGTAFLTDLFVHPAQQGRGWGTALLDAVWPRQGERATASSQHPAALTAYLRRGLVPRWPLLYLELAGLDDPAETVVRSEVWHPGDAGWTLPAPGMTLLAHGGGRAAVSRGRPVITLERAEAEADDLVEIVASARSWAARDGVVRLHLPAPHPALPALMALGARVVDHDVWCTTPGAVDLIDPTRTLPSPALC